MARTLGSAGSLGVDEEACVAAGVDPLRLARLPARLASYVEDGRLPCLQVAIERDGRRLLDWAIGFRDVERQVPVGHDTIFRIYSMTKPLVSIALLTLFEEGRIGLDDPVGTYLPALAEPTVYLGGGLDAVQTRPATSPITVRHLLTHTSGLTYDFFQETVVDGLYRRRRLTTAGWPGSLADFVDALGELPLLFDPGSRWNYSVATDVVGRLVEVVSGQSLPQALAERVLGPLGMRETGFAVPAGAEDRLAACYLQGPDGLVLQDDPSRSRFLETPSLTSGGGGLVSTTDDYLRFCRMLLEGGRADPTSTAALGADGSARPSRRDDGSSTNRSAPGDRERVLSPRTVELLLANHLPDGADLATLAFSQASRVRGVGFGLGGAVVVDPVAAGQLASPGQWSWGGMASTAFFVDPEEDLAVVAMTQLIPSGELRLRSELDTLVYQALID